MAFNEKHRNQREQMFYNSKQRNQRKSIGFTVTKPVANEKDRLYCEKHTNQRENTGFIARSVGTKDKHFGFIIKSIEPTRINWLSFFYTGTNEKALALLQKT